ncbi:MAG: hypothetical protein JWN72_1867 [Thermoleophilia bacterium]|nr:hypothetical protein [Thermoleophilia bacterium]
MSRFLRENSSDAVARATVPELFFDLVYVLAVELLVARLVHDLSWHNAFEVTFLLLTV